MKFFNQFVLDANPHHQLILHTFYTRWNNWICSIILANANMLNINKIIMSADREEIRWKFQIFLGSIKTVMTWAENQRDILSDSFDKESRDIEKNRNYWLAGIGFGITIGASLIVSEKIELFYSFYLLIAAAIGIGIFVVTNSYIYKRFTQQNQINLSHLNWDRLK